jgi:hypothetical protein
MHNIILILTIAFLPIISCNQSSDEVTHSTETLPLYKDRTFELDKKHIDSKIDVSDIKNLKAWDRDLLLRLFVPAAGVNTVYTFKSKYKIPQNIDETEGVYDEYLIIEVDSNGTIKDTLLYEDGPKQGPIFWSLFRGSNNKLPLKDLKNISQLNLVCPYESFDRIHKGKAVITASTQ